MNGATALKFVSPTRAHWNRINVKIINLDKENGKLILSERAAFERERSDALSTLKVGNTMTGTVSGIVKFGIFVAFEGLEGWCIFLKSFGAMFRRP